MTAGAAGPTDAVTDATLLAASATGHTDSFAMFMRRHQGPVTRYLVMFTGSSDVDDAVQDTFVSAWRAAGSFRGDASARSWLYAIARHAVHHQQRRRVDEPAQLESLEALAERAGWGNLEAVTMPEDEDERAALLHRALARLPQEERDVLTLRDLDGLSGDETAAALQLSLAAMKSRLHRARLHRVAVARTLRAEERRDVGTFISRSGGTE